MKLKVYGWTGRRHEAMMPGNHHGQTREIMAAKSAAEVQRVAGLTRSEWEHSGCETGNEKEIETAMAKPGTVFWAPLNLRWDQEWTES